LGLLTWVATMGNPWLGFLIFFSLSMGLGLPLSVLALFSGQLQRLPRAGGWMLWVRRLMGWVLVAMAVYFTRPVLPEILKLLLPVGVALAAGLHLGWIDQNQASFKAFPWLKTLVGTACWVLAAFWLTTWALAGARGLLAAIRRGDHAPGRSPKKARDHRLLCRLVRPLPRTRSRHLPSSGCGPTG
jgi:thiol:disulfide interchange protein DsbD